MGAATSAVTQWIENDFDLTRINPLVVINDAIFGGISGLLSVSGLSTFWLAPLNAVLGTFQIIINAAITGDRIDTTEIIITAILNYAFSFIPTTSINAQESYEKISLAKVKSATSIKNKHIYNFKIKSEYLRMVKSAGIYALTTPMFSLTIAKAIEYIERDLYGTRKYTVIN